jgi:hypothetical protein
MPYGLGHGVFEFIEAVGFLSLRRRRYRDWHALLGRLGCRHCGLCCPCLHPGIITDASGGRMVVINVVAITFGQVVAYGIDAGFANVHGGWRWMFGLAADLPILSSGVT